MSEDIKEAQGELTARVMGKPGVSGTAIGLHGGEPCLIVYVLDETAAESVPRSVMGFPVRTEVSGRFRRL